MQTGRVLIRPILLCYIFVAILIPFDAYAFRCGSGMVTIGDSRSKVLATCGRPSSKEKVSAAKSDRKKKKKKIERDLSDSPKHRKYVAGIEKWIYNCGDDDFIYALTFENGRLKNEDTEGRGSGRSECRGK
jgi:hypothetical protein